MSVQPPKKEEEGGKLKKTHTQEIRREAIQKERMFLTDGALQKLTEYKYVSGGYTPLDLLLDKYIWVPAVELLPMWMAPNLVTLIGLLTMLTPCCAVLFYCPDFGENTVAPSWVYMTAGLSIFFYQILDAIDGKQARRTGASSPLGQLFDHGCDSMSTSFILLTVASTFQLGFSFSTASFLFSVMLLFWSAQWSEHNTHQFAHQVGGFGVTEAQILCVLIEIFAAIFGPGIYSTPFPIIGVSFAHIMAVVISFSGVAAFGYFAFNIISHPDAKVGKALTQLIPILVLIFAGCLWTSVPQNHPILVLGTLGLVFTHLTLWMILCSTTHMEYPIFHTIVLPILPLFIINYSNILPDYLDVLLGGYACFVVHKMKQFIAGVIQEICSHLDIWCLTIKKKEDKKKQ